MTDSKVISITIHCWVCNINRCNIITIMSLKEGKENTASCTGVTFYIILELSQYKSEADSDKMYMVSPKTTRKKRNPGKFINKIKMLH